MDFGLVGIGFGASLAAGLATGLGALPLLFVPRLSEPLKDTLLGFAAGVMLSASFFSLIVPALDHAITEFASRTAGALAVAAAIMLGAAALAAVNAIVPHEHVVHGRAGPQTAAIRRIWLFVFAVTLHNFPEGLAVGVGFGGGDLARGTTLAIGIGLQNMPEGLAVAAALLTLNYSRSAAVLIAMATGLVEPVGGLLGVAAVSTFTPLLPWGLGFAAGAMIFVVSNEIVPETHRTGHENLSTFGLVAGLCVMLVLDIVFA